MAVRLLNFFGVLGNLTSVTAAELLLCNYLRPNSTTTNKSAQFLNHSRPEIFLSIMAQLYYETVKTFGRAASNLNMISVELNTSGCVIIPLLFLISMKNRSVLLHFLEPLQGTKAYNSVCLQVFLHCQWLGYLSYYSQSGLIRRGCLYSFPSLRGCKQFTFLPTLLLQNVTLEIWNKTWAGRQKCPRSEDAAVA